MASPHARTGYYTACGVFIMERGNDKLLWHPWDPAGTAFAAASSSRRQDPFAAAGAEIHPRVRFPSGRRRPSPRMKYCLGAAWADPTLAEWHLLYKLCKAMFGIIRRDPETVLVPPTTTRIPGQIIRTGTEGLRLLGLLLTVRAQYVRSPCAVTSHVVPIL